MDRKELKKRVRAVVDQVSSPGRFKLVGFRYSPDSMDVILARGPENDFLKTDWELRIKAGLEKEFAVGLGFDTRVFFDDDWHFFSENHAAQMDEN